MQLAYDGEADRVVLIAEEAAAPGEPDDAGEATGADVGGSDEAIGRFVITREQAAALVGRSESLVTSGRPPCPFCGFPLDPAGHSCPKTNGHGPPRL